MTHAMQQISEQGLSAIQAARNNVASLTPGYQAKGRALAATLLSECKGQGSTWGRYLQDMLSLEAEGRKAFRTEIASAVKNDRETELNDADKTAQRSAKVRLSEFVAISKALDAGMVISREWAFHYTVGQARTFLQSSASSGTKRGRKATPTLDKVKAYLIKMAPTIEGGMSSIYDLTSTLLLLENTPNEART